LKLNLDGPQRIPCLVRRLSGTSGDAQVLRLLPPFILQPDHVELLRSALLDVGA
jgi:hypothetical protein